MLIKTGVQVRKQKTQISLDKQYVCFSRKNQYYFTLFFRSFIAVAHRIGS